MRLKATNYILLLGLLALAACGGGSGGGDSSSASSDSQKATPTNVSGKELSCGERVCPEGIAMILSKTIASEEANRCTGILIDQQHIMTNFHCLPEKAKRKGDRCAGLLTASFLKDGEQINVGCDRVISASGIPSRENSMQDFAVVKLDRKVELKSFKLNFEGRGLNEKVTMFKVDPINSKEAVIKKVNCELKANTLFGETFDGPKTSLVHTLGCETMPGNSGAPLINENNQVIAIHQASLKNTGNLSEIMSGRQIQDLGTATNLGCLCQDGAEFSQCAKLPTTCKEAGPQFSDDKREKIVAEAFRKFINGDRVHKLFQHEARFLTTEFQWAITFGTRFVSSSKNNEFSVYMTVRPSCIADSEEVIRNSESFIDPSPTNFNLSNIIDDVPVCRMNFKLNKNHEISELSFDLNDCTRGKAFIDYNLRAIRTNIIPSYFGFYKDTFQKVGSPFGRPLTLQHCIR